jgi:hypothetical protein
LAATIFVDTSCTLVGAITAANSDTPAGGCSAGSGADTIFFLAPTISTLTAVNNTDLAGPNGLPVVTSAITVDAGNSTITRASSAPRFRILAVGPTGNLRLLSTTVSGGLAGDLSSGHGGGIYNGGTLTLTSSTVSGNTAGVHGGGLFNGGTLSLTTYSTVSGNTASSLGGGIYNGGTLTTENTTVSDNTASGGGGIYSSVGNTLTLTRSTVSGNTAGRVGGGLFNNGTLTLTSSTVSGNSVGSNGGGLFTVGLGPLTLTNSTVSGNTAGRGGGGLSTSRYSTVTLTNSTVSGNTAAGSGGGFSTSYNSTVTLTNSMVSDNKAAGGGGGLFNRSGTVTLTNSTVEGNSAQSRGGALYSAGLDSEGTHNAAILTLANTTVADNTAGMTGGGVRNGDLLRLTNSTLSGNSAADRGGGVENTGTATLGNSTVSGNTAGDGGGGVYNLGTVILTSSTVSRNASGRIAGGLLNTGTVTLAQTLISGNTAPVIGPEAYSSLAPVIADNFNVFGHDGSSGVAGFTLGASDILPDRPLSAILDPSLGYNGGPTRTHALVFASPAIDAIPGNSCVAVTDQRGAPRPQDADGDTITDCDIGAVERGLIPVQAAITSTTLDCRSAGCRVSVRCNLQETECTNPIDVAVRRRAVRAADGTVTKAARQIRFAAGVANIPPGGTQRVRLRLTRQGRQLAERLRRRLRGVLGIQEIAATVSNTPVTISRTDVTIRLKRRRP